MNPEDAAAAREDAARLRERDPVETAREHVRQRLIVDPDTVAAVLTELDAAVKYRAEGWTRYHEAADERDELRRALDQINRDPTWDRG
jgi:hypothetical protein